jgi:hypothetical protein
MYGADYNKHSICKGFYFRIVVAEGKYKPNRAYVANCNVCNASRKKMLILVCGLQKQKL